MVMWSRPEAVRLGEGSGEYVEAFRVCENTLEQRAIAVFQQLGDVQGVLRVCFALRTTPTATYL